MTHFILCDTYSQAVIGAKAFANHYSKEEMKVVKRQTEVTVGDNKFIFINRNDPRSTLVRHGGFIQYKDFVKKYFSSPPQNSQTP